MSGIVIRVNGLDRAKVIPSEIEAALDRFRAALVEPLVADFIAHEPQGGRWPKPRRKTIQDQTKGFVRGIYVIVGTFNSRYADALDKGATVSPNKKKVIRFRGRDGQFVFTRKPILHTARPFFGSILARVPTIVAAVYDETFSQIGEGDD